MEYIYIINLHVFLHVSVQKYAGNTFKCTLKCMHKINFILCELLFAKHILENSNILIN